MATQPGEVTDPDALTLYAMLGQVEPGRRLVVHYWTRIDGGVRYVWQHMKSCCRRVVLEEGVAPLWQHSTVVRAFLTERENPAKSCWCRLAAAYTEVP